MTVHASDDMALVLSALLRSRDPLQQGQDVLDALFESGRLAARARCMRCDLPHATHAFAWCDRCRFESEAEMEGALLRLDEQLEDEREADAGYLL